MSETSPCIGCPNELRDKKVCLNKCPRLKAYQHNKPYRHISYYQKTTKSSQIVPLASESTKTAKPINQIINWKKTIPTKKPLPKPKICIFPNCDHLATRRRHTICLRCYQAWRRGTVDHPTLGIWKKLTTQEVSQNRAIKFPKCLIPGCNSVGNKRLLCRPHYLKWHRGAILHPKFGVFKREDGKTIINNKKSEVKKHMEDPVSYERTVKDESVTPAEKLILHNMTLDFTNYQAIYRELKKQAVEMMLPLDHVIMSILSLGLYAARADERRKEDNTNAK